MASVIDINDPKNPRVQPVRVINPAQWQDQPVPERQWLIPGICVRGGATLLNGDGGVGKSLLCLQMQTALAVEKPWLGIATPRNGGRGTRSLGIYCEDEPEELQRRQRDICQYYGCEMRDLDGLAFMMSRVGESNTLMSFNRREGGGTITNFFRQVEAIINEHGIEVVIIDTAADTFGGNEIDREQVRTFVQKLRAWALKSRGTVIITQHPSVSGMASGAGSSGSTGWNNSVRSRIYLTQPKRTDDDGDEIPTNERFLKFMKSNYGPKAAKLRLAWEGGVFKTVGELKPGGLFDELALREKVLDAAADYVQRGIELSPDPQSRTCLVNRIRNDRNDMGHVSQSMLIKAHAQLVEDGKLVTITMKSADRRIRSYVRPSWMRYPGEERETP